VLVLGLAVAQTTFFFPYYFGAYTERSYQAFDGDLRRAAEQHDRAGFEKVAKPYSELAFRYYLVRNFGHTCESSRTEAQRILALP
jgi:hypothetical protein